jgi:hypothetical protein
VESPRSQRKGKREHDNADQHPAPPRHQTKRNVLGFRFFHNNLNANYTHGIPGSEITVINRTDADPLIDTETILAAPYNRCARKYAGCFIYYSLGYAETSHLSYLPISLGTGLCSGLARAAF